MTTPINVLNDPQSSTALVLKPPPTFEVVYNGQPHTTPLPLVAQNQKGEFDFVDDMAGNLGVALNLQRYVPVPLGSSLLIIIPRPYFEDKTSPTYLYELRWRLRTLVDSNEATGHGNTVHPWSLVPSFGNEGTPATTPAEARRIIMPSYVSEVVTPTVTGTSNRALVGPAMFGTSSQGMYEALSQSAADADLAYGPSTFPPLLRPALGNELSICITRAGGGNWDFTDGTTGDAAISNLYGTNLAGRRHPYFPGIGAFLVSMSRSTTP